MTIGNYRPIRGATALEQQVADAYGEQLAICREHLANDSISDHLRDQLENTLYEAAAKLRQLRAHVYARVGAE